MNSVALATLISALACGLVGGFFFAFSCCVMKSLQELPPAHGIAAMQAINRVVINPWFMVPFLGMAVGCVPMAVLAWLGGQGAWSAYCLFGSGLYFVGTFVVTMAFNVPLNEALALATAPTSEAHAVWEAYLTRWTAWNHVRAAAALAASLAFILALWVRA